jgi:hypothetical protein
MKYIALIAGLLLGMQTVCPAADKKPAKDPESGFSGKVLETTNAATYTYVLVDAAGQKLWAAAPQFRVKPGDTVEIPEAMAMKKYHSKTLNRTFDVVYFAGSVSVNGTKPAGAGNPTGAMGELPKGHPPISGSPAPQGAMSQMPAGHPPITAGETKVNVSGVKKADGGKTVAEVYAEKAKLKGQQTTVRGKVVKVNLNIMGKNWLHLQDGTGAAGSNDLLVTTAADAKVGDTVLVTGAVTPDKDFGSGYKYSVLLENAKVTVEPR